MPIVIPHRFSSFLNDTSRFNKISVLIIGTFNPAEPELNLLNQSEQNEFIKIKETKKFQKFNQVQNFYDRPQNRFWKIMDYLNDGDYYSDGNFKNKNKEGLKNYKNITIPNQVFERQRKFCEEKGIFITDIVKQIKPSSFTNIYDNFPDTIIEKSSPEFNTKNIKVIIKDFNIKKVIVNFNFENNSIPKICSEINNLKSNFLTSEFLSLPSTSGARGKSYEFLINEWKKNF